jgi:hypothetical protein
MAPAFDMKNYIKEQPIIVTTLLRDAKPAAILPGAATADNFLRTQEAVMAGDLNWLPPTFRIGFPIIMCFSAFLGLAVI